MGGAHERGDGDDMTWWHRRSTPWLLYLATLASGLPFAAALAAANPMPEGACSGIGWGCSLYGWDVAGFALTILGVPFAVVLGLVLGLLSLARPPVAAVAAAVGLAVPWLLTVAVLVTAS